MEANTSPLRATIVKPEQALPIKPFGLDMKVSLTTEATGGAISVLMAWHKPGEGPPDHLHFSQNELIRQWMASRGERPVEAIVTSDSTSAGDWKSAFTKRTADGFAEAFAEDIILEATTLNKPVQGRDKVKVVMAAASKIYKSLDFTATATVGAKQYLEWVAEAHAGVQFSGVTVLTRDTTGSIVHVAIHHRPMEAAIFFSETMGKSLRGELDPTYFLNEHAARRRANR
jgi:hypothetical protein